MNHPLDNREESTIRTARHPEVARWNIGRNHRAESRHGGRVGVRPVHHGRLVRRVPGLMALMPFPARGSGHACVGVDTCTILEDYNVSAAVDAWLGAY